MHNIDTQGQGTEDLQDPMQEAGDCDPQQEDVQQQNPKDGKSVIVEIFRIQIVQQEPARDVLICHDKDSHQQQGKAVQRERQALLHSRPEAGRQTAQNQILQPGPETECLAEEFLEGLADTIGDQLGQDADQNQSRPETDQTSEPFLRRCFSDV